MILTLLAALTFSSQDLEVWRKLDSEGRACASCHSPDGIELAAFRFDNHDITRRASKHLAATDQAAILQLIEKKRASFQRSVAFVPMRDRPLQPGGASLPGATVEAREIAFSRELATKAPSLMGKPIASLADAKRAKDELLALDLRSLKVGFDFSRLSEDGFHGKDHATMAQWLPDTPVNLSPSALAAQDKYLAEPSVANLRAIDAEIIKSNRAKSATEAFSLAKYRSMLTLQHRLRVQAGLATEELTQPLGTGVDANPIWQVADAARVYSTFDAGSLGLPESVARSKTQELAAQLKALRAPWFWMGWLEDPALSRSGQLPETQTGHYFARSLLADGPYPIHALFAMVERMVYLGYAPEVWTFFTPRHFELQYSAFAVEGLLATCQPKNPVQRKAFETLLANSFRMSLYLLVEDLEATHKVIRPESQRGQINFVLSQTKSLTAADKRLAAKALQLLASATREFSR